LCALNQLNFADRVSIVCVSGCVLTYANLRSFLRWFEVLNDDNQPSPKRPRLDDRCPEGRDQLSDDIVGEAGRAKVEGEFML
jgi:hypothetical protein